MPSSVSSCSGLQVEKNNAVDVMRWNADRSQINASLQHSSCTTQLTDWKVSTSGPCFTVFYRGRGTKSLQRRLSDKRQITTRCTLDVCKEKTAAWHDSGSSTLQTSAVGESGERLKSTWEQSLFQSVPFNSVPLPDHPFLYGLIFILKVMKLNK